MAKIATVEISVKDIHLIKELIRVLEANIHKLPIEVINALGELVDNEDKDNG